MKRKEVQSSKESVVMEETEGHEEGGVEGDEGGGEDGGGGGGGGEGERGDAVVPQEPLPESHEEINDGEDEKHPLILRSSGDVDTDQPKEEKDSQKGEKTEKEEGKESEKVSLLEKTTGLKREEENGNSIPRASDSPVKEGSVVGVNGGGGYSRASHSTTTADNTTTTTTTLCSSVTSQPFLRQGVMTAISCLAGLSNGKIYAYPAVALARWEDAGVHLSTAQTTWFASAPLVVAVAVCLVSGVVVEKVGMRRVLALGSLLLAISWATLGYATSFWILLLARVLQGVVASLFMVVITVYPVEVSTVRWRGIMAGVSEAMVMLGAFLTYLGGLMISPATLAYIFAGMLLPQLICFFFMRESPLWLARRDRMEAATTSLAWLRCATGEDVKEEMEHIKASVHIERKEKPSALQQLLMLRKIVYLKPLTLCICVLFFKELTGQYAALTYTVTMFKLAGSTLDPYVCAVVMGIARFLPCFMSWLLIERLPRRLLLSCGLAVSAVSLATLGGVLKYYDSVQGGLPESLGLIPIVCISVFTFAFGCAVGPTSWTLVAELLPSQLRNVGAGLLNMCFSLFLFIVGISFPYCVVALGAGGVFLIYAVCTIIGVVFVLTCLPETRGKSFIEIQKAINPKLKQSSVSSCQEENVV